MNTECLPQLLLLDLELILAVALIYFVSVSIYSHNMKNYFSNKHSYQGINKKLINGEKINRKERSYLQTRYLIQHNKLKSQHTNSWQRFKAGIKVLWCRFIFLFNKSYLHPEQ